MGKKNRYKLARDRGKRIKSLENKMLEKNKEIAELKSEVVSLDRLLAWPG